MIVVDTKQLELSLLNVVVNPRDAMPNGVVVTVTTRSMRLGEDQANRALAAGDFVVIDVADEGDGMSAVLSLHAGQCSMSSRCIQRRQNASSLKTDRFMVGKAKL